MFYLSSCIHFAQILGKIHKPKNYTFIFCFHFCLLFWVSGIGLCLHSEEQQYSFCNLCCFSRAWIAFPKNAEVKHRIYFMRPKEKPFKHSQVNQLVYLYSYKRTSDACYLCCFTIYMVLHDLQDPVQTSCSGPLWRGIHLPYYFLTVGIPHQNA